MDTSGFDPSAALNSLGDALNMVAGAGETTGGSFLMALGFGATDTGVGALVGVPTMAGGAAVAGAGISTISSGANDLSDDLSKMFSRSVG